MIKINLIEPKMVYIGVNFPRDERGWIEKAWIEKAWIEKASTINEHLDTFRERTGGSTRLVYDPRGVHDIYVSVDAHDTHIYMAEAKNRFPEYVFVPGINPRAHLAWHPETAGSVENEYPEYMEAEAT